MNDEAIVELRMLKSDKKSPNGSGLLNLVEQLSGSEESVSSW